MGAHTLERVAIDPKGYGDGADDEWRCSCGAKFDVDDGEGIFAHGQEHSVVADRLRDILFLEYDGSYDLDKPWNGDTLEAIGQLADEFGLRAEAKAIRKGGA